ncbi:hypothetical protein GY45DRAFT_1021434 [Cubamyces sp. BRFM 1775]|nr:hypothetical protein GY45DRAFT_1021434 [Cubamyces sp. BRFM 1775]
MHRNFRPLPPLKMAEVDTELAKATSLFICHRCPLDTAVSATQSCLHWRTEHPDLNWNDAWPIDEMFDRRRKRSEWPKLLPWVCAMPGGPLCAKGKTAVPCRPNGSWASLKLIENHSLNGPTPCLKLLAEGEHAEVPDYSVSADAATVITARLESDQRQLVCSTCHFMLKDDSKRTQDIHLPRDMVHIAHHVRTRHGETLSNDCILLIFDS